MIWKRKSIFEDDCIYTDMKSKVCHLAEGSFLTFCTLTGMNFPKMSNMNYA